MRRSGCPARRSLPPTESGLIRPLSKFDSTLGYPGEGPRPLTLASRPGRDLRVTVKATTARRYLQMLDRFADWLARSQLPELEQIVDTPALLNAILVSYVQTLYDQGLPFSWGSETLVGIQFRWPATRGSLRPAWAVVSRWRTYEPIEMRVPMAVEVLLALAVAARSLGWSRTAACLLLCFHLLLRPSEMALALRRHLVLPGDTGGSALTGVFVVAKAKTSERGGPRVQSVLLEDQSLLAVAAKEFASLPPTASLCPGQLRGLTERFKYLKQVTGLTNAPFTLASMRGGGAIHHFRTHQNLGLLQYRGRWESAKSMQHYIQMGSAALAYSQLPADTQARVRALADLAPNVF